MSGNNNQDENIPPEVGNALVTALVQMVSL